MGGKDLSQLENNKERHRMGVETISNLQRIHKNSKNLNEIRCSGPKNEKTKSDTKNKVSKIYKPPILDTKERLNRVKNYSRSLRSKRVHTKQIVQDADNERDKTTLNKRILYSVPIDLVSILTELGWIINMKKS